MTAHPSTTFLPCSAGPTPVPSPARPFSLPPSPSLSLPLSLPLSLSLSLSFSLFPPCLDLRPPPRRFIRVRRERGVGGGRRGGGTPRVSGPGEAAT